MENNLTHHGIKGQKWGVRRYQNADGSLTPAGKKRADKLERKSRKQDVKNRRNLSSDELKKKIEKIKLEKELKNLTDEDLAPGRNYVSGIMKSIGTKTLSVAGAGLLAYGVKIAMTKEFDVKEAASYIAANPNKKK